MKRRGNCWPNAEQQLLLRAAVSPESEAKKAWEQYCQCVNLQQVDGASLALLPLVYRNLKSEDSAPFKFCKSKYRHTWCSNQIAWETCQPLFAQMRAEGIDQIILLKGMAMILQIYRDFGVRVLGDIDLLIQREQVPLAIPLFQRLGWQGIFLPGWDFQNPEHLRRRHALHFTHSSGVQADLHWSFMEENSPALDRAVFAQAIPLSHPGLYGPHLTDLLLQTYIHGTKQSPVPLIRWIPDAMALLKQPIDWQRLTDLAAKGHVGLRLFWALQFLRDQFQAPIPMDVLNRLSSSKLEMCEYWFSSQGYPHLAAWFRYCLSHEHFCLSRQLLHLPRFLQSTARLSSPWYIPFFAIYWVFKRLLRRFGWRLGTF